MLPMATAMTRTALEQCAVELTELDSARAALVAARDELIVTAYESGETVRRVALWARLSPGGVMRVIARH
jgi:hypothetical protein